MLKLELQRTKFDADFIPNPKSRNTTNLVNLSKNPATRKENITTFFALVNKRINGYLCATAEENRYEIKIDILTTLAWFDEFQLQKFPISEMLDVKILDKQNNSLIQGPIGLNFSSYLRDYDFHVVLPRIIHKIASQEEAESFGLLHGLMFQLQFKSFHDSGFFTSPAIMAISVSSNRTYALNAKTHPVLGRNYTENGEASFTANYFKKMGLDVAYYMAKGMCAPLAFYHQKDDLEKRNSVQLWALVSVMDTIQKIYRPEIYAVNKPAGRNFKPSLTEADFTRPPIFYDRDERDFLLIANQADYVATHFLNPYQAVLKELMAEFRAKL